MTGAKIVSSKLPPKVAPNEKVPWKIELRTVEDGTNDDYIGGAMFSRPVKSGDNPVNAAVFVLADPQTGEPKKMPPGKRASGTVSIRPLTEWKTAIPDKLEWAAIVGWLERTDEKRWELHGTDRRNHDITVKRAPGIVDWIKDHPKLVAAGTASAVGLTYVATQE